MLTLLPLALASALAPAATAIHFVADAAGLGTHTVGLSTTFDYGRDPFLSPSAYDDSYGVGIGVDYGLIDRLQVGLSGHFGEQINAACPSAAGSTGVFGGFSFFGGCGTTNSTALLAHMRFGIARLAGNHVQLGVQASGGVLLGGYRGHSYSGAAALLTSFSLHRALLQLGVGYMHVWAGSFSAAGPYGTARLEVAAGPTGARPFIGAQMSDRQALDFGSHQLVGAVSTGVAWAL